MVNFTTVLGIDQKHLSQLKLVWPTWARHKPSLLKQPLVIFYDQQDGLSERDIHEATNHPRPRIYSWPPPRVEYHGDPASKWYHPQRYKMLAGFVHVPAMTVETPYWLKIDTDVVATGMPCWIDKDWFDKSPAIVAHRWSFTKPGNQMELLDAWVEKHKRNLAMLAEQPPLDLHPEPGSERLGHSRIISWCGFFNTVMTRLASDFANSTVGYCQLPVPSQDGYLWYCAERLQHIIRRVNMKDRGWEWWSTDHNVKKAVERVVNCGL